MEDAKMQQLYDTLNKLRPKGHSGLGSFGGVKKGEDGLPKNGLYSYFVREGHSGYKKWEDEVEAEGGEALETESKEDRKKRKKEQKRAKKEAEAKAASDSEGDVKQKKSSKKRKRDEASEAASEDAEEETDSKEVLVKFNWTKHIQKTVKKAEGRQMPVKELQRAVISRALEVYEDGAKKKHLKQVFKQQVATVKKVVIEGSMAMYGKPKEITVVEEDTETVVEEEDEVASEAEAQEPPKKRRKSEDKRKKPKEEEEEKEEETKSKKKKDKKQQKKKGA